MDYLDKPSRPAKSFEDLVVWRKAHEMVVVAYRMAAAFPKMELFSLGSQVRRAAVSVPANIAEGFRKRGARDHARHLNIAQGSLEELRYYLVLAADLGYAVPAGLREQVAGVSQLLGRYYDAVISEAGSSR